MAGIGSTIRYKNDTAMRKRFFDSSAFAHPAKMHGGLFLDIVERYTKPGDVILDVMGGIGTALLATMYGRSVVICEMEPHFLETIPKSWAKIQRNGPALGHTLGEVLILRGDARALPIASADHIVTSPPFQSVEPWQDKDFEMHDGRKQPRRGATSPGYTRPSAIITSPPYEGIINEHSEGPGASHDGRSTSLPGYTRPSAIITSPPYENTATGPVGGGIDWDKAIGGYHRQGKTGGTAYTRPVDAVVSSPPYEDNSGISDKGIAVGKGLDFDRYSHNPPYNQIGTIEAAKERGRTSGTNIGNLRGPAYWESMRMCYAEMHRVLKPNGILCLVLKGYTRAGVYQDLPADTARLVESLGFTKFDEWRRELWSLSFWRILQKRRDPAAFDDRLKYETILAFRKSPLSPFLAGKGEEG